MPAVEQNKKCQVCGGQHVLCLPTADLLDGNAEYEYRCPATGRTVRFKPGITFNLVAPACPPGSVIIRPVD